MLDRDERVMIAELAVRIDALETDVKRLKALLNFVELGPERQAELRDAAG